MSDLGKEYVYLSTVGEGSYGYVWQCQERATGRIVAIKAFKQAHTDPQIKKLALREIRTLQGMAHPAIIPLLDAFRSKSGRVYMVFPYVGRSALKLLGSHPCGLPAPQLKLLTWQLLQALAYMHGKKVVHRDIKPANILLSETGEVKLIDFGFARPTHCDPRGAEPMSAYILTRWYRPPEVLVGAEYGPAADIWSLGCTVAELATGRPLFPGKSTADQLWRVLRCFPHLPAAYARRAAADQSLRDVLGARLDGRTLRQRLPGCDQSLVQLLEACLQPDPFRRCTAAELLQMPYFWAVPRMVSGTHLQYLGLCQAGSEGQAGLAGTGGTNLQPQAHAYAQLRYDAQQHTQRQEAQQQEERQQRHQERQLHRKRGHPSAGEPAVLPPMAREAAQQQLAVAPPPPPDCDCDTDLQDRASGGGTGTGTTGAGGALHGAEHEMPAVRAAPATSVAAAVDAAALQEASAAPGGASHSRSHSCAQAGGSSASPVASAGSGGTATVATTASVSPLISPLLLRSCDTGGLSSNPRARSGAQARFAAGPQAPLPPGVAAAGSHGVSGRRPHSPLSSNASDLCASRTVSGLEPMGPCCCATEGPEHVRLPPGAITDAAAVEGAAAAAMAAGDLTRRSAKASCGGGKTFSFPQLLLEQHAHSSGTRQRAPPRRALTSSAMAMAEKVAATRGGGTTSVTGLVATRETSTSSSTGGMRSTSHARSRLFRDTAATAPVPLEAQEAEGRDGSGGDAGGGAEQREQRQQGTRLLPLLAPARGPRVSAPAMCTFRREASASDGRSVRRSGATAGMGVREIEHLETHPEAWLPAAVEESGLAPAGGHPVNHGSVASMVPFRDPRVSSLEVRKEKKMGSIAAVLHAIRDLTCH